jgi:mRNA-degrading endonuclease RelE of RelBE toxin-antitoxin system
MSNDDEASRNHLEFSKRARKDMKKLPRQEAARLAVDIQARLMPSPPPDNADLDWIAGHRPFMRLRIGDHRVIFRALTSHEMACLVMRRGTLDGPTGYLIERVVDKKDFDRVKRTLDFVELA